MPPVALLASAGAVAPPGATFFDAWKVQRLSDRHRKPMGEAGFAQAGFVWGKWLAFCSVRGVAWHAATASDVQAFNHDIFPRKPTVATCQTK